MARPSQRIPKRNFPIILGDVSLRLPDYLLKKSQKGSATSPKINISKFIRFVKTQNLINEVFSESVAKKLKVQRYQGTVSPSLKYSFKEDSDSGDEAKSQTAEKKPSYYTKGEARVMVDEIVSTFFNAPEYDAS